MGLDDKRPREWWIGKTEMARDCILKEKPETTFREFIHVIAFSTYEQVLKERDELRAEIDLRAKPTVAKLRKDLAAAESQCAINFQGFVEAAGALADRNATIAKLDALLTKLEERIKELER